MAHVYVQDEALDVQMLNNHAPTSWPSMCGHLHIITDYHFPQLARSARTLT